MLWWGWLFIGVVVLAAIALVITMLRRTVRVTPELQARKLELEATQARLEIERRANASLLHDKQQLSKQLSEIKVHHAKQLLQLRDEVRSERKRLANNPDALDARLTELLSEGGVAEDQPE